jgi:hypothetical protein
LILSINILYLYSRYTMGRYREEIGNVKQKVLP